MGIKKSFGQSKFVFLYSFVERGSFFLSYIILARALSKTDYGQIVTLFAFTNILGAVFDFGLPFYLQRETAAGRKISGILGSVFSFKLTVFVFYSLATYFYFYIGGGVDGALILPVCLITFVFGFASLFNSVLWGSKEYDRSFYYALISRTLQPLLLILLAVAGFPLEIMLWAYLTAAVMHFNLLIRYLRKSGVKLLPLRINFIELKSVLRSSLPIGGGLVFVLIYDRIDILFIQKISGLEAVAIYAAAYSLYRGLQIFANMLLVPRYSDFSERYAKEGSVRIKEVRDAFSVLLAVSLILTAGTMILARPAISIIYGVRFSGSAGILILLAAGIPGVFLNNLTGVISNSVRKEDIPLKSTGAGAAVNIILNYFLISMFSVTGAVIATVITEYFVFSLQLLLLIKHNHKIKTFERSFAE